ncbi:uncharacterized protein BT62DRAFT_777315 [Guyanagaster necrorhizus]|uniref:Uncharacterized protein n=1 Tax=Guyanagaster necrorhizus TaxID=856835 RepID=A0A9P7VU31_9AGAR|nr:uncharacterized protein BT62DRAFT_777315 [Guyanagaster necrorhizus MCA 3950]KAG7447481.1 hypothetical protein BT62DRAFT_777315 [Guyanagaster necrorhizus MCA 3950]
MIDKCSLPCDLTPEDAPPSYDASTSGNAQTNVDSKNQAVNTISGPSSGRSPTTQRVFHGGLAAQSYSFPFGWFSARSSREIKSTIISLVQDLVRPTSLSGVCNEILSSCAQTCASYSMSLSSILQERFCEDHTPLYWAIINKPRQTEEKSEEILSALLRYSVPPTLSTISEIRLACLVSSDQNLFRQLRCELKPISGMDEMLLGTTGSDNVRVVDTNATEGAFAAEIEISRFQKRMRVGKEVEVEFIAQAHLWLLSFFVMPQYKPGSPRRGSWCVGLSLMESSPPTWVDSRLIIQDQPAQDVVDEESPPKKMISLRIKSPAELISTNTFAHASRRSRQSPHWRIVL